MKRHKKKIHFTFTKEIPLKMNRPKKIKTCNFFVKRPLKLGEIWRSTFSTIFKKSHLEGVFEFLHPDPQLDQHFKPARNLCGQLLTRYIYKYIYTWSIYPQSIKKIEGHFWYDLKKIYPRGCFWNFASGPPTWPTF